MECTTPRSFWKATAPIAAAGLVSQVGQSWFWKSVRWTHAAALTPPLMALVIGVGAKLSSAVVTQDSASLSAAIGTAVPAVMLLLPHLKGESAGVTLALVSTFAGNLLLVGSIANLIVVDIARKSGIAIDWRQHAVTGIPVTIGTLALAWAWLRWAA